MKTDNRQQALTIVAITAIALLLGDRLVFTPLTKTWKDRAARIVELRKKVSQGALTLEREHVIHDRWEQMRTNTLPGNTSLAEQRMLKAFERWSQDSRISVTSVKPQWKHGTEDYQTLECRVDASGSLETVSRFLYNIEKDPLALKMEVVELGTRDSNGQQLTLGLLVSGLLLNAPDK